MSHPLCWLLASSEHNRCVVLRKGNERLGNQRVVNIPRLEERSEVCRLCAAGVPLQVLDQSTPIRVLHRRSPMVRPRTVYRYAYGTPVPHGETHGGQCHVRKAQSWHSAGKVSRSLERVRACSAGARTANSSGCSFFLKCLISLGQTLCFRLCLCVWLCLHPLLSRMRCEEIPEDNTLFLLHLTTQVTACCSAPLGV